MNLPVVISERPREVGATLSRVSRIFRVTAGLLFGLAALILLSIAIGPVAIPLETVFSILLYQATFGAFPSSACLGSNVTPAQCSVLIEVVNARIPAVFLAVAAGGALGLSGATLQGLFRNPLADPYLLGISAGAAIGATFLYAFDLRLTYSAWALPLFAFMGALVPGMIVWAAARSGRNSPETLLLTGVALNAFLSAILATLLLYNPTGDLQASFWLLGGMSGAGVGPDLLVFGVLLILGTWLALHGSRFNLLQLGPESAQGLGVDVRRTTMRAVLLTTIVTGTAVAFTGVIGFVGLVSPHIVRRILGYDYRIVLPVSAVIGGMFLTVAWDVSQVVIPSVVIPVGIPTAFVGAPFFVYLLYRRRRLAPMEA
jgi:iron complex transport system permease protein